LKSVRGVGSHLMILVPLCNWWWSFYFVDITLQMFLLYFSNLVIVILFPVMVLNTFTCSFHIVKPCAVVNTSAYDSRKLTLMTTRWGAQQGLKHVACMIIYRCIRWYLTVYLFKWKKCQPLFHCVHFTTMGHFHCGLNNWDAVISCPWFWQLTI